MAESKRFLFLSITIMPVMGGHFHGKFLSTDQTVIDLWPNLANALVAPPIKHFKTVLHMEFNCFTYGVQHCYEPYPASFVMIGKTVSDS